MEPITGHFVLALDDCIAASRYLVGRKSLNRWINGILLLFFAHLLWTLRDSFHLREMIVSVLPFVALVAFLKFLLPIIQRSVFAKHPEIDMQMVYSISESSIRFESNVSTTETKWKAFKKVVHAPKGFIFMVSSQSFHFLPIRAFSSPADIENLKYLARKHATDFREVK